MHISHLRNAIATDLQSYLISCSWVNTYTHIFMRNIGIHRLPRSTSVVTQRNRFSLGGESSRLDPSSIYHLCLYFALVFKLSHGIWVKRKVVWLSLFLYTYIIIKIFSKLSNVQLTVCIHLEGIAYTMLSVEDKQILIVILGIQAKAPPSVWTSDGIQVN